MSAQAIIGIIFGGILVIIFIGVPVCLGIDSWKLRRTLWLSKQAAAVRITGQERIDELRRLKEKEIADPDYREGMKEVEKFLSEGRKGA